MSESDSKQCWYLTGELSFETVGTLARQIPDKKQLPLVDLSQVTRSDSAGLAFLIELIKQNEAIRFQHIPQQLLSLATVTGVEDLLAAHQLAA